MKKQLNKSINNVVTKNKQFVQSENNRNGITLVALVVTIVILLILAGITITMLFGENGIIKKAQDAAEATKNGQDKDMQGLANLEGWISEATGEYAWRVNNEGTKVINKNYPEGIEIGSYINYDCTPVDGAETSYTSKAEKTGYTADQTFTVADYKYGWRVLGADDKGQLLLIAEEVVPCTTADGSDNTWENNFGYVAPDRTSYYMDAKLECIYGIEELKAICNIYGHGAGATGGKLITIEDINKITGVNENNIDKNGTKYGKGYLYEYGNSVTYYWDGTEYPYYEASNGIKGNLIVSHTDGFHWYDESTKEWKKSERSTTATTEKKERITTLTNTYYDYISSDIMDSTSLVYKVLFTNSSTGAYKEPYFEEEGIAYYIDTFATWVGGDHVNDWDFASSGLGGVWENTVSSGSQIFQSNNYQDMDYDYYGVRPLISLKSNVKLTRSGDRDNCAFYNLEVE